MASTYKAYLGDGLGPLEWIRNWHIPHPGRVGGRLILHLTMPAGELGITITIAS
jgi:zeaxanthin epoxidase